MNNSDINIQKMLLLAKRKIIEIRENGEINQLIDRRNGKIRKRSINRFDNHTRYVRTFITIDRKKFHVSSHRLIWVYFKGKIPKGYQINHIDGDRTNNNISNLELVTAKENIRHSIYVLETHNSCVGEKNINAKLTWKDVRAIRRMRFKDNMKLSDIREAIGKKVSRVNIGYICANKNWKET